MDLRLRHPVFRRRKWFQGRTIRGSEAADVYWFSPDRLEMTEADWNEGFAKSLGVFLNGDALPDPDERGGRIVDDSFLLMFNAHHELLGFTIPKEPWSDKWTVVIDTYHPAIEEGVHTHRAGEEVTVEARSLVVMRRIEPKPATG